MRPDSGYIAGMFYELQLNFDLGCKESYKRSRKIVSVHMFGN